MNSVHARLLSLLLLSGSSAVGASACHAGNPVLSAEPAWSTWETIHDLPGTYTKPSQTEAYVGNAWIDAWWQHEPVDEDSTGTLKVPGDAATIQGALDLASNGMHVVVAPGTYHENVDFRGKDVVLRAEEGPEKTMLVGLGDGATVTFRSREGPGAVLTGFTIRNGTGLIVPGQEGGMRQGGGICILGASPTVTWNVIEENHGENGGGILCDGGAQPLIAHNLIQHNTAHKGAGIRMSKSSPIILGNLIVDNHASIIGGGLYWRQASAPLVANNTILDNRADEYGGGLFCSSIPPARRWVTLANNLFAGNRAGLGGHEISLNLEGISLRLVANAVQDAEGGILLRQEMEEVVWESSNLSIGEDEVVEALRGEGRIEGAGDTAWGRVLPVDVLGQPRPVDSQQDERTPVSIGAVERWPKAQPGAGAGWTGPFWEALRRASIRNP